MILSSYVPGSDLLYTIITTTNVAEYWEILFVATFVITAGGIIYLFTHNKIMHIILLCSLIIMFSIFIVFDTQLILDKKRLIFTIDDYIIAALTIYIDIIQLLMNLLDILNIFSYY